MMDLESLAMSKSCVCELYYLHADYMLVNLINYKTYELQIQTYYFSQKEIEITSYYNIHWDNG